MKRFAFYILAACLIIGGGCASRQEKLPLSRKQVTPEESSFAAGAGRAPTAQTSYAFAKILVKQGRDRDATYILSRIVREHPEFVPAYNELAGVYVRADRVDDALEVLGDAVKRSPRDGVLENNLGMCHMLQGHNETALAAFTRAVEAMPSNPSYRSNRAAALALVHREAEAEKEYRTVMGKSEAKENLAILTKARDEQEKIRRENDRSATQPSARGPGVIWKGAMN